MIPRSCVNFLKFFGEGSLSQNSDLGNWFFLESPIHYRHAEVDAHHLSWAHSTAGQHLWI
ncbi:unnamed protein product, partial [Nesidiocoris tenuis]